MRVELAAPAHGDAHDVKEVRTFEISHYCQLFALGRDVAGDTEVPRIAGAVVSHGQVSGKGGGDDPRR